MTDSRSIVRTPLVSPSPLARYRAEGAGKRAVHGDLVFTSEPGPGADLNHALVVGPASPERLFSLAAGYFGPADFAVTVESDVAPLLEGHLLAAGWAMVEEEPAMLLTPIPGPVPPAPGISIELVTSCAGFQHFMTLAPQTVGVVPSLEAATDPDVALFTGYVDGEPVATARLTRFGAVGELTGIVTAGDHRRRGFGTAMTWAAIAEGARRGCTVITLTATPMGYSVYLRMGFVPICSYRTYLPPGSVLEDA